MRRLVPLLASLVFCAALVTAASAGPGAQIGVYLDPAGTVSAGDIQPFVVFDVFVVASEPVDSGYLGFEYGLTIEPNLGTLISLGCMINQPGSINVGDCFNAIVGTGQCLSGGPVVLAQYQFISFDTAPVPDVRLCLGPSTPSSVGGVAPAYLDCESGLYPFELAGSGCLVLNPTFAPDMTQLGIGDGFPELGGTALVPVNVSRAPIIKGDASQLAGIDLELSWDATLASLEAVHLGGVTQEWFVEFNAGPGTADISMAGTSPVNVPFAALAEVLQLEFLATNGEGFTPIDITSSRLFDIDQMAIDHTTYPGSLTAGCDKGDPVEDDEVNSADAIRTLLIAVGLFQPTDLQFCAADMNGDGVVDVGDAILVLQKAVGLIPARPADTTPEVYFLSGREPGEVLLQVVDAAGLDVLLHFDPEQVRFLSAATDGPDGLVIGNSKTPGSLRLGFAAADEFTGTVRLRFDLAREGSTMQVKFASAFDRLAERHVIDVRDFDFVFGVTGIGNTPGLGQALEFLGGHPNPFNPNTELRFRLAVDGDVTVSIFDVAGRRVRTLPLVGISAGENEVHWNGKDDEGRTVASGIYHVRVESARGSDGGRVVLLK